jgi:hypothetical protein
MSRDHLRLFASAVESIERALADVVKVGRSKPARQAFDRLRRQLADRVEGARFTEYCFQSSSPVHVTHDRMKPEST